jgi:hypothetical protein
MKTKLFAAAAVLAVAFAAPAVAQQVGSVGAAYNWSQLEAGPFEADGSSLNLDGSVALKTQSPWTVTLNGAANIADNDVSDDSTFSGAAHATYGFDNARLGGFVAASNPADETLWAVGVEGQKYLGKVTLAGVLAYGQIDDVDADLFGARGEVRYFVSDDFRLDAGLGYTKIDTNGGDTDAWTSGVGGEYKFAASPWSLFGNYAHTELNDFDVKSDAINLGVRYTFGGSLKARDNAGADLADINALFGAGLR